MFASPLEALIARTGSTDHDPLWVDAIFLEALAYVRVLAPCKRADWVDWVNLPEDVQSVVTSAMARVSMNPRGIRQETIGEYSYTVAGNSAVDGGFFSPGETRVITSSAGCGGGIRTVPLTLEAPLHLDAPEVGESYGSVTDEAHAYKPAGTHWEPPGHGNGWTGRWI